MSLGTFAAGEYTGTWNSGALGLIEGGTILQRSVHGEDVRASLYGDTVIDGVYRGGDCFVLFTIKEWTTSTKSILWPFGSNFGEIGACGRMMTDLAQSLVLTAATGTAAATNGFATYTFAKAIISPGHSYGIPHANAQRDVPVVMRCYPYDSGGGTIAWFTTTDPA